MNERCDECNKEARKEGRKQISKYPFFSVIMEYDDCHCHDVAISIFFRSRRAASSKLFWRALFHLLVLHVQLASCLPVAA
jgi:hypothetical protein